VVKKNFLKENFVLVVGLALPILLMVGFMVASGLPQMLTDPPKYDLVFSTPDYSASGGMALNVRLVVDGHVLKAQYARTNTAGSYSSTGWKKLYLYEAQTQKVRQLTFGFPRNMEDITSAREEIVEATKDLRLDTTLQSPDGYELTTDGRSHNGLLSDLFFGGGYSGEPRLRKGSSSVKLTTGDSATVFSYGNVEFVGWVSGSR